MLTIKCKWESDENIALPSFATAKLFEKLVIENHSLESQLLALWSYNYREGDDFTLGELLDVVIAEGIEAIRIQTCGQ